ncbi:MAG TPA: hypothetical protein VF961_01455 [Pyrinomonadaceae bacterium]
MRTFQKNNYWNWQGLSTFDLREGAHQVAAELPEATAGGILT